MRYAKKIAALIVCIIVLTSLCPLVFAESNSGISVSDNFDSLELTDAVFNKYPNASLGQTSTVFTQSSNTQKSFKIVEAEGVGGDISKVLEVANTDGDYVTLPFSNDIIHRAGIVTQVSYHIRFTKLPGDNPAPKDKVGTTFFSFGGDGFKNAGRDNNFKAPAGGNSITLQKDFWYKIVGKIDIDGKLTTYLLNAENEEILLEQVTSKTFADGSAFGFSALHLQPNASTLADGTKAYITCQIDNAEVIQYDPGTPPQLSVASIKHNDTNVIRNRALIFNFNQELSEDSDITLVSESGDEVNCSISVNAFGKLIVNFNELLERKTTYVLSLGEVKNTNGVACIEESITFTTEDLHIWNDIEISSVSMGDTTQISFRLSDIYSYPTFSGMVMAAAYEGEKMTGLDLLELNEVATECVLTKEFNIKSTAESEIQLMLLDKENGPVPLANGKFAVN